MLSDYESKGTESALLYHEEGWSGKIRPGGLLPDVNTLAVAKSSQNY